MTRHFHTQTTSDDDTQAPVCFKIHGDNPLQAKIALVYRLRSEQTAWLDSDLDDADKNDMEEAHDTAVHDINAYDGSQTTIQASIIVPDGTEHTYRITAVTDDCGAS